MRKIISGKELENYSIRDSIVDLLDDDLRKRIEKEYKQYLQEVKKDIIDEAKSKNFNIDAIDIDYWDGDIIIVPSFEQPKVLVERYNLKIGEIKTKPYYEMKNDPVFTIKDFSSDFRYQVGKQSFKYFRDVFEYEINPSYAELINILYEEGYKAAYDILKNDEYEFNSFLDVFNYEILRIVEHYSDLLTTDDEDELEELITDLIRAYKEYGFDYIEAFSKDIIDVFTNILNDILNEVDVMTLNEYIEYELEESKKIEVEIDNRNFIHIIYDIIE